jgi:toxin HigB-1
MNKVRQWTQIEPAALRKIAQIDLAASLGDMRPPLGNCLEALSGYRKGQWSIRVNDQFRICFRWSEEGPQVIEIVDYH